MEQSQVGKGTASAVPTAAVPFYSKNLTNPCDANIPCRINILTSLLY
jgi:hypothetical protein